MCLERQARRARRLADHLSQFGRRRRGEIDPPLPFGQRDQFGDFGGATLILAPPEATNLIFKLNGDFTSPAFSAGATTTTPGARVGLARNVNLAFSSGGNAASWAVTNCNASAGAAMVR
jgi:hypothetical protein